MSTAPEQADEPERVPEIWGVHLAQRVLADAVHALATPAATATALGDLLASSAHQDERLERLERALIRLTARLETARGLAQVPRTRRIIGVRTAVEAAMDGDLSQLPDWMEGRSVEPLAASTPAARPIEPGLYIEAVPLPLHWLLVCGVRDAQAGGDDWTLHTECTAHEVRLTIAPLRTSAELWSGLARAAGGRAGTDWVAFPRADEATHTVL